MFTVVILRLLRVFLRLAARKLHRALGFDDGSCFNTTHTTHTSVSDLRALQRIRVVSAKLELLLLPQSPLPGSYSGKARNTPPKH
uniref:Putative secreted protein n=1 Tax=Anopheles marajoara TaxID=58244 RepID=A0A2M4CAT3_9DIPT